MTKHEFDAYAGAYSESIETTLGVFGKGHDFYVRSKAEILLRVFRSLSPRTEELNVLDVGCGVGLVHPLIAGSVGELHGVDVSEESIEVARRDNPGVRYESFDGHRLPYPDGRFDSAYAICVMHHVPVAQWPGFMREMARVVAPGGKIVVIEHNPFNPATRWVVNHCPIDKDAVLLKPSRVEALMEAAGIGRTATRYVLFTPFEGRPFRTLDAMLERLPLGAQYVTIGDVGGTPASAG